MVKNLCWLIVLGVFLSSCGADDGIELAEIPFRVEFEIPAGLNVVEDHFFEISNISNITEQVLDGRGIDRSRVNFMQPKMAKMTVLFDNTPLNFIDECSIRLFSSNIGRRDEAFWTPQIQLNQGSVLDIPGTLIDAQEFLDQERLNLEIRFDTRTVNSQFINIRLDLSFSARGK